MTIDDHCERTSPAAEPLVDLGIPPATATPVRRRSVLDEPPEVAAVSDLTAFLAGDIEIDEYIARACGRETSPDGVTTPVVERVESAPTTAI